MTDPAAVEEEPLDATAEELYETAPCGYLACRPDGTIVRVNRTFEAWTGHAREKLLGRRFSDLLTPAGRIYHETHYAPLLRMQGSVREIALDIVRADGSRLPALVNSVQQTGEDGTPRLVRTTVFDATDRRAYERELLAARRREREIALELQRSLLAGRLPEADDLRIEFHHRPAVSGLEVGGDWYDAFWVGPRSVALVVGDVVGKGIAAAATMGQLRSAVRALALGGMAPGAMLDALDDYVERHEVGRMATVVYAELAIDRRELRYACAGHPPPVMVFAAGGPQPAFLEGGRSLPLNASLKRAPRGDATAPMGPGDRVVLYTDGLIERRTRPLGEGLELLRRHIGVRPGLEALARELPDPTHPDDICLLAAELRAG